MVNQAKPCQLDEQFWDDLIIRIENREVIPVVGPGAITYRDSPLDPASNDGADHEQLLYPKLAADLADSLQPALTFACPPTDLQEVVFAQLKARQRLDRIYKKLKDLVDSRNLIPGRTVYSLASIEGFPLYLTTTFDPLLWRAVQQVRSGDRSKDPWGAMSLRGGSSSMSTPFEDLDFPCVYHIFGRARQAARDFVVWDDDALYFLLALDKQFSTLGSLEDALKGRNLLVLGSSFPDWLLRLFFHVLKRKNILTPDDSEFFVAESLRLTRRHRVVLYFDRRWREVRVLDSGPREFIAQLLIRWRKRHPAADDNPLNMKKTKREINRSPCCIFVSYVGADLDIARHIVDQLQEAGLHVWFNKEQITIGEDWEETLREAVDQTCGLFLSLISANSAKGLENYAQFERNIASKRRERMAENAIFYLPIRIDDGEPMIPGNEPRGIKKIQAERKIGGNLDPDFIGQLRDLQNACRAQKGLPPLEPPV